ncbi:A/G-specific adenine glycosylase [uncultured delta proteobacterium]|uniref:Adenine DNA glycosylase n=1 Tax=uncultured delta proteobacterium TaxID=34034 RepID=A0A212JVU9_9DELT|nr:A/G-specific adenine glycosylase [uncultured delta proteobacterium]
MLPVFDLTADQKKDFAAKLLDWFAANQRPLPWRETYDPYSVWISEIMLQQTQMERGVAYFTAWMKTFPTIASVASAGEEAVLKAWEGLGYYSRARNLHKAAKMIMRDFGGEFPRGAEAIRSLPGVGEYTAGAIAAIAFNAPEAAVDANVMRIFSRLCDVDVPLTHPGVKAFIADEVRALMAGSPPRLFAQALMELGALVCAKKPNCPACPLEAYCEASRLGTAEKRPKKKTTVTYTSLEMSTGIVMKDGRLFIQKRPPYGVWAGLWEFPGGCLEPGETPEQALVREVAEETELPVSIRDKVAVIRHSYTTCRVTMHAFFCNLLDAAKNPVLHAAVEGKWVLPGETANYAFPAGHRKLLEQLGWGKGREFP